VAVFRVLDDGLGDVTEFAVLAGGLVAEHGKGFVGGAPVVTHDDAAGLIAFGTGWLIASLIPTTEREQQAAVKAKESAAPLAHEAADEVPPGKWIPS
jgi:hypothetical protein